MKEPLVTSSFLMKLLKIPSDQQAVCKTFEGIFNKLIGPNVLLEKRLSETDKNVKPLSTQDKFSKVSLCCTSANYTIVCRSNECVMKFRIFYFL